jgi:Na+-transporting NADH:ubiquinone oxidoreductase subunit NqrB
MKRFLMLVGVAVVAAVMYVAASPASQQAKAPTAKQFNLLKKQVASLTKSLKTVKTEANAAAGFIASCLVSTNAGVLPVNQFGATGTGTTIGYMFGTTTAASSVRTALDIDTAATPGGYLQGVDPSCVTSGSALGHSSSTGLHFRAERSLGR